MLTGSPILTTPPAGIIPAGAPLPQGPYRFTFSDPERRVFRIRDRVNGRPITTSEWADRHRVVTEGGRLGPWSTSYTEYSRQAMDAFDLPWIREVILCWGPQSAKTQVALNCIAKSADQDPGPAMWVAATETKASDAVNKKLLPMFRKSPRLRDLLSPRSQDATRRVIRLTNGMEIMVTWATSASELASESIRYLVLDETDKYPEYAGREADPISLAEQRVNAYPHNYKILKISTPSTDAGVIWTALTEEADEIWDFIVPCPVCGHRQRMEFEYITWPADVKDWRTIQRMRLAHYSCRDCGMKWTDRTRNDAVRRGSWQPRDPVPSGRPEKVALHLPAWYSPFVSLSRIAADYIRGLDDPARHMAFVTQDKAEGYSEKVDTKQESDVLTEHLGPTPPMIVPASAVALTCALDTHKDYFRFVVTAWDAPGSGFACHVVHYGELATFEDIETLLFDTFYAIEGSDDELMGIWRAAIDTGAGRNDAEKEGTRTQEVYDWLKKMEFRRTVFGVKGLSTRDPQRKVALSRVGAVSSRAKKMNKHAQNQGTIELRLLDTVHFKMQIHFRLTRGENQTKRLLFHSGTGEDFVREILAEELHKDRKGNYYWKRTRAQNHYLDCLVYNHALVDPEWHPNLTSLSKIGRLCVVKGGPDRPQMIHTPHTQPHPRRRVLSQGVR